MARTVNYRLQTGPGAWVRASGELPFDITGLSNGEIYEVDIGDGVLLERTPEAPPSSGITPQTALVRDEVAPGIAEWTVACGFAADAGDRIVIAAYAVQDTGAAGTVLTMTVNGETLTRHNFVASATGNVAVFTVELAGAITSGSNIVATLSAGTTANVWRLQPARAVGGWTVTDADQGAGSGTALVQNVTIPAGGAIFGLFAANIISPVQDVTGATELSNTTFTNANRRCVMVGQSGLSAETDRPVTMTDASSTSATRRGAIIALTPP